MQLYKNEILSPALLQAKGGIIAKGGKSGKPRAEQQPRMGKVENQGLNNSQEWEKEKTQGLVKNKEFGLTQMSFETYVTTVTTPLVEFWPYIFFRLDFFPRKC